MGAATPGRASVAPDAGTARPMGSAAAGRGVVTSGPVSPAAAGAASGQAGAGSRGGAPAVPSDGLDDGEPRARQDGRGETGGEADDADPEGGLRGARAELRRKLRTQRQLRLVTLMSLAALVLLVLPAFFAVRATVSDPVFASLDSLDVPAWASGNEKDFKSNSNLCLLECSFRERTADSGQPFAQTTDVYTKALTKAGWTPRKVEGCPEMPVRPEEGTYSCWSRDELTLDLAVGLPNCAVDQVAAELNPVAGAEPPKPADAAACQGSTVVIKVWNAIADQRGKKDTAPGPIGETPNPVLRTDDSILQQTKPTPEAS
ncbi:hypothetical protein QLQ12_33875 [Actinoplanes sp. NEAU-A12]|uniref:Uncharacterized protein n=1 Tax=Actinoplanes sandaracinus TaxID=3045177 RepID=A0ABT6WV49_9ACTN|nr:hypothetical protein [Actinoplanes sandaracinus]MDI6103613.1 hypothetical protein [Actinoplanes sandaracinus]